MIKVVLADWSGYPACRKKTFSWVDPEDASNRIGYSIDCGISPLLQGFFSYKAGEEFSVVVVVSSSTGRDTSRLAEIEKMCNRYAFIDELFIKDNLNMDIGSYSLGYQYLLASQFSGDIIFLNTSCRPPRADNWLASYKKLFHSSPDIGLCGISINSAISPHVQSFFIYTSTDILSRCFSGSSLTKVPVCSSKEQLILDGEVWISQVVISNGFSLISSSFPDFVYSSKQLKWLQPEGDLRYMKDYIAIANQI